MFYVVCHDQAGQFHYYHTNRRCRPASQTLCDVPHTLCVLFGDSGKQSDLLPMLCVRRLCHLLEEIMMLTSGTKVEQKKKASTNSALLMF